MYKTFKYYDDNGRRLSIMGEIIKSPIGDLILMTVIRCSKEDNFNKTVAIEIYTAIKEGRYFDYSEVTISILDNKPGKSFIDWCESNLYKEKLEYRVFTRKILTRRGKEKTLPLTKFKIVNKKKLSQVL